MQRNFLQINNKIHPSKRFNNTAILHLRKILSKLISNSYNNSNTFGFLIGNSHLFQKVLYKWLISNTRIQVVVVSVILFAIKMIAGNYQKFAVLSVHHISILIIH